MTKSRKEQNNRLMNDRLVLIESVKTYTLPLLMVISSSALANGTDAGTDITATATVQYSVAGNTQPQVTSPPATFKVDRKIDLTVAGTNGSSVQVAPSSTGNIVSFTVTNDGNATQDFELSLSHDLNDDFDIGTGDAASTPCTFSFTQPVSGATVTANLGDVATIDDLAKDASVTVTVTCDVQSSVTNGQISTVDLLAVARAQDGSALTETVGANTSAEDVVFADGLGTSTDGALRNASHSATQSFVVSASELSSAFTKTATILWDPVNGTTNPKPIPGAIVEYTIQLTNDDGDSTNGTSADVSNLVLTDALPGETTFLENGTYDIAGLGTNRHGVAALAPGDYQNAKGILISFDNTNWTPLTNANGDNAVVATKTVSANYSAGTITVNVDTLAGGANPETLYVKYRAQVNSAPTAW